MPELPEIETVRLQLLQVLPGRVIKKIDILKPKSFIGNKRLAEGKKVTGVDRKAKMLLIDLEDATVLAIHFRMTGQLVWIPTTHNSKLTTQSRIAGGHPTADFTGELPSKHTRVIFHLNRGTLFFNDQRLFGWVRVGDKLTINNLQFLKSLGPEPFELDEQGFAKIFLKIKKPIKLALMDQTRISGIGNIYANDALWEAKINPRRPADSLRRLQYRDLLAAVKKVLNEGIKYGGATAADAKYIDLSGLGGHYQEHFRVYDREGEECLREDGGIIHKYALGGRGTYFCPKCQK
jgi:formamidopyrimidine-DNA glycosylase